MRTALALFILHYFLFSTSVWGQVLEKITDLDKELKVASTPSQKAILHNKLAYALLDIDITKARICVEKAYKIGQQHNLTTQEAESQWILGQIYRRQLEYKQAKQALEKALRIFKDIQSDLGIQKTQIEMAVLYSDQAMHAKTDSLFAVLSSIISEKYSKDFLHPYLHYCIGVHILRKGEYTRSLEHFRLALTMFEEHNNIFWVARMQNGIGLSYKNIGFKRLAL
jgi:tetratricopeptide (TPR) repeat protein